MKKNPTLSDLFKFVRESMGRTQGEVASAAEITQQSLHIFEKGQASLAKETLKKMAVPLSINPEYIDEKSPYPFANPAGLIKMFATEGSVSKSVLEPLYFVSGFDKRLDLIFLVSPDNIENKLFRKLGLLWIFSIAFRDGHDNIFLLRGKKDLINLEVGFPPLVFKILESKCLFSIAQHKADKGLFDKIKEKWSDVSRQDIEPLFHEVNFEEVNKEWTDDEKIQLTSQRGLLMDTLSDLDLIIIKSMRDARVSHDEILKFIKSK
jgi:DNA-binding XRE family transcriptional regulator